MQLKSPSFTIFELLIVVVIIASVYTLFIQRIDNLNRRTPPIKIENLPQYMQEIEVHEKASIICLKSWDDRCIDCRLYRDGEVTDVRFDFFDEAIPKVYALNTERFFDEIDFGKMAINDREFRDICFQFDKRYNGSTSDFVLEYDNQFFIYYPYLKKSAEIVKDKAIAEERLLAIRDKLKEVK